MDVGGREYPKQGEGLKHRDNVTKSKDVRGGNSRSYLRRRPSPAQDKSSRRPIACCPLVKIHGIGSSPRRMLSFTALMMSGLTEVGSASVFPNGTRAADGPEPQGSAFSLWEYNPLHG